MDRIGVFLQHVVTRAAQPADLTLEPPCVDDCPVDVERVLGGAQLGTERAGEGPDLVSAGRRGGGVGGGEYVLEVETRVREEPRHGAQGGERVVG